MEELIVGGVTRVAVGHGNSAAVADGLAGGVAVLAQPGSVTVARGVADAVGPGRSSLLVVPDRDDAKTLNEVQRIVAWMAGEGIRRDGALIAVGGGAVTDLGGFIASIYMRGIEARYLPTTLLGAIDAAIGGKTAVNVEGKNLIGTFRHPSRVVVDLDILAALPVAALAEGLAEAIKAGVIADLALFEEIERSGIEADLGSVVERSIAVKASIVASDFTETGVRAHLNFGHTIGHAIEILTGWPHGHGVAVGMVAAAVASERVAGFTETGRIRSALERVGLPVEVVGVDPEAARRLVGLDKKADSSGIRMVLVEALGKPLVSPVDSATLDAALAAVGIGGT